MDVEEDYELVLMRLDEAFPSSPPTNVADQDWGDYYDATRAFRRIGTGWDANAVFQNRSVIGFVNGQAFLYLIPRFFRASIVSGDIVWDVFEYIIRPLKDRLCVVGHSLNSRQSEAILQTLRWWRNRLLQCEADTRSLLKDIKEIEQRLSNTKNE